MKTLKHLIIAACSLALVTGSIGLAGCSSSKYHRTAGRTIDDASITTKVKTDLLRDSVMRGSDVNVDTYNGHVQLNGWVNTPEQKRKRKKWRRGLAEFKRCKTIWRSKRLPDPAISSE